MAAATSATVGDRRARSSVMPPLRVVRTLLLAAVAVSVVHYVDNTVRFDDFIAADVGDRTLPFVDRWMIPAAWLLLTPCALLGYRRYQQQRWPQAAAWLGAYSTSGLVGIGHYVDLSPRDMSLFQNLHVGTDIVLGALVLAVAITVVVRLPRHATS